MINERRISNMPILKFSRSMQHAAKRAQAAQPKMITPKGIGVGAQFNRDQIRSNSNDD